MKFPEEPSFYLKHLKENDQMHMPKILFREFAADSAYFERFVPLNAKFSGLIVSGLGILSCFSFCFLSFFLSFFFFDSN